ncbi:VOC family protein [Brevundimonas sp.]|uniref:VOC family protein n=1 Tax=Brevundimonas sp. TaxID=1871086 RepID=UPI00286B638A|nr:VOC family protein [Brevundimonas sp.]
MKIVTSVSMPGTCREAFGFYAKVLGGEIITAITYGEAFPETPAPTNDWLMYCWLQVGDQVLLGSDMHPDHAPDLHKKKDGFDVTLHFDTVEEARRVFETLSEGGEVSIPFGVNDCAPGFSGFTDRFGVPWMTNVTPAA